MKISIIGGTGFLGNNLIEALLDKNFKLLVTGTNKSKAKKYSWYKEVEFVELDLNQNENIILFKKIASSDKLINLSWEGLPNYKSLFHYESVLMKQYYFLKKMVQYGIKEIIITGTCMEYGKINGPLDVNMKTDPANPYALAKDTLRKFMFLLKNDYTFRIKWLRLFYMYGKGQSKYSILSQLESAIQKGDKSFNMSMGDQERDYMPVEDVVNEIIKISLNVDKSGIFNVCSGKPITIRKLTENYINSCNASIDLNFGYYPYPDYEAMSFWGVK
jgi:nucleoside-diphosphate-sugar epimerase|tara:strand:+ start:104 stop:925 length:822 start_codon:yes stop_codon:yes gene_type:complete